MKARQLQLAFATGLGALVLAFAADARVVQEPVTIAADCPPARVAQRGGGISLQQAVALAQQRFNGRVLRAETVTRGGRQVHEILLLDDGRARTVRIDAQSGQFM